MLIDVEYTGEMEASFGVNAFGKKGHITIKVDTHTHSTPPTPSFILLCVGEQVGWSSTSHLVPSTIQPLGVRIRSRASATV